MSKKTIRLPSGLGGAFVRGLPSGNVHSAARHKLFSPGEKQREFTACTHWIAWVVRAASSSWQV